MMSGIVRMNHIGGGQGAIAVSLHVFVDRCIEERETSCQLAHDVDIPFETHARLACEAGAVEGRPEIMVMVAYHQPITRGETQGLPEVRRDVIAHLRSLGLVSSYPRSPQPGGLYTLVTTKAFLSPFGLVSLRDLGFGAHRGYRLLKEGPP
ncbi:MULTISPECIES: SMC-Scp complex subunit ScpB [Rhizobium]|uniref:SMC-Scp complex subunit ScpB n=1 Tax=Rhizobium TaxID=379 RepID=UPI0021A9351D|nr:SMC-Scp complex subunit ScpB [Rhizobium leguminosarum]UWM84930.1 SMC-Scp complex subunit ScpB [Rhizobium leguminosarum bv. viciae]